MRWKVPAVMLAVVISAMMLFPGSLAYEWKEGDGWGYSWKLDNEAVLKEHRDYLIGPYSEVRYYSSNLTGEETSMLYVRCVSTSENYAKFSFKGASIIDTKGDEHHTFGGNWPGELKQSERINYTSVFNGTFTLVKHTYKANPYEWAPEYTTYGISHMVCNVSVHIEKYNISYWLSYINSSGNEVNYENNFNTYGDVVYRNLKMDFSPPLPFLPENMENATLSIENLRISYSTERSGHLNYVSGNVSIDRNLDKHISGDSSELIIFQMNIKNISAPDILWSLPTVTHIWPGFIWSDSDNKDIKDIAIENLVKTDTCTIEDNFFGDIVKESYSALTLFGTFPYTPSNYIKSHSATESEVDSYISEISESDSEDNDNEASIPFLSVPAMLFSVSVALLIYAGRKRLT